MKKIFSRILLLAVTILSASLLVTCGKIEDPVRVDGGLVSGVSGTDPSVMVYLGIPFAAPPVGDLRWQAPQPVVPWDGVLAADKYCDACIQNAARSRLPWSEEFMHQGDISEDCLYLNVWTTATSTRDKHPVMVYIYGGGFSEGSNSIAVYDGEELAKKGVVAVGINYRVGTLGFFAHPELTAESEHGVSGNQGLLDQVAALEWIQRNITAFGGDPDRVTIYGQSAGAMSVDALMRSPLTEGLFARAIIQSGPGLFSSSSMSGGTPLSAAEETGVAFAESLGAESLAELRAIPADTLLAQRGGRSGVIADGWFLPEDNQHENVVPVMNGFTANDMGTSTGLASSPDATVSTYETQVRERYGENAEDFLTLYPAESEAAISELSLSSGRDRARVSVSLWAAEKAKGNRQVYTYYFSRAIPWPEHPEFGAFHTGEVPYVFNNLKQLDRPWEAIDYTLADQVSSYWVNFAKTGNPNGPGLPEWPSVNESGGTTMELGVSTGAIPLADDPAKISFWQEAAGQ